MVGTYFSAALCGDREVLKVHPSDLDALCDEPINLHDGTGEIGEGQQETRTQDPTGSITQAR